MSISQVGVTLQGGLQVVNPVNVDPYYGPYESVNDANANVPTLLRLCINGSTVIGRTVGIVELGIEKEYWWSGGVLDINLVEKSSGGGSGTSLTDTITAGEDITIRNIVYLKSDGKYWIADNTVESKCSTELRIVTDSTILTNATGQSLRVGLGSGFSGLTVGVPYFLSTSGGITSTLPEVDGIFQRYVGTPISTSILEFNPSAEWIELTTTAPDIQLASAVTTELVATSNIAAFKAVDATGIESNSANTGTRNKCIGISKAAILSGFSGDIVTSGDISNGSWSFSTGNIIYLNGNTLSATSPTSGFSQIIGVAKSSTVITVDIKQAILI